MATGPRTEEGKKRSSLNAMKHGLTAQSAHALERLAEELHVNSREIHERMRLHYQPEDALEEELVKRVADCLCRLERARAMENRVMCRQTDPLRPTASYERIARYERSIDVHLYRAIAALERNKQLRIKNLPKRTLACSMYSSSRSVRFGLNAKTGSRLAAPTQSQ